MTNLPRPATQTDEYLYDIAMSLRQLNLSLAQLVTLLPMPSPGPIGEPDLDLVQLREPEAPKRKRG